MTHATGCRNVRARHCSFTRRRARERARARVHLPSFLTKTATNTSASVKFSLLSYSTLMLASATDSAASRYEPRCARLVRILQCRSDKRDRTNRRRGGGYAFVARGGIAEASFSSPTIIFFFFFFLSFLFLQRRYASWLYLHTMEYLVASYFRRRGRE